MNPKYELGRLTGVAVGAAVGVGVGEGRCSAAVEFSSPNAAIAQTSAASKRNTLRRFINTSEEARRGRGCPGGENALRRYRTLSSPAADLNRTGTNPTVMHASVVLAAGALAAIIACASPAGAQTSPTPAPSRSAAPSVWCVDVEDPQPPFDQIKQYVTFAHAAQALCAGDAAGAEKTLAAILPAMKTRINDGTWWIDYGRAYFYALIATRDDDAALRWLKDFGAWNPRPNERLFWSGNDVGSFAAYVADDPNVTRSPDEQAAYKGDPRLAAALAALKAGDLPGAEALMQQSVAQYGGSLRLVMLGDLYAQQRNWPQAFAAWVSAANAGPDVIEMEFSTLDTWNVAALEMIYYYRAHAPAR